MRRQPKTHAVGVGIFRCFVDGCSDGNNYREPCIFALDPYLTGTNAGSTPRSGYTPLPTRPGECYNLGLPLRPHNLGGIPQVAIRLAAGLFR